MAARAAAAARAAVAAPSAAAVANVPVVGAPWRSATGQAAAGWAAERRDAAAVVLVGGAGRAAGRRDAAAVAAGHREMAMTLAAAEARAGREGGEASLRGCWREGRGGGGGRSALRHQKSIPILLGLPKEG